jgi:hypothetical protein
LLIKRKDWVYECGGVEHQKRRKRKLIHEGIVGFNFETEPDTIAEGKVSLLRQERDDRFQLTGTTAAIAIN